jgi:hypothetical protein
MSATQLDYSEIASNSRIQYLRGREVWNQQVGESELDGRY